MNGIKELHDKLRDLVLLSGVNKDHYEGLYDLIDSTVVSEEMLQEVYNSYTALEQGSWREARRIRELLPETVWRMYNNLPEMQDTREVVALRGELLKLKTNYYGLFKEIRRGLRKKKKTADKDTAPPSLESVPR